MIILSNLSSDYIIFILFQSYQEVNLLQTRLNPSCVVCYNHYNTLKHHGRSSRPSASEPGTRVSPAGVAERPKAELALPIP